MKVRIIKENSGNHPIGAVLEGPDTHWLCQLDMGIAEPVDDEAKAKHAVHLKQMEDRRKRIEKLAEIAQVEADNKAKAERAADLAAFEQTLREPE